MSEDRKYTVSFEITFPWTQEEAELAEYLLCRRYRLDHLKYNRLSAGIARAALDIVGQEAMAEALKSYHTSITAKVPVEINKEMLNEF